MNMQLRKLEGSLADLHSEATLEKLEARKEFSVELAAERSQAAEALSDARQTAEAALRLVRQEAAEAEAAMRSQIAEISARCADAEAQQAILEKELHSVSTRTASGPWMVNGQESWGSAVAHHHSPSEQGLEATATTVGVGVVVDQAAITISSRRGSGLVTSVAASTMPTDLRIPAQQTVGLSHNTPSQSLIAATPRADNATEATTTRVNGVGRKQPGPEPGPERGRFGRRRRRRPAGWRQRRRTRSWSSKSPDGTEKMQRL